MRHGATTLGVTLLLAGGTVTAGAAAAGPAVPRPTPITKPGGLSADQTQLATGDCGLANVTCKPALPGSCTGTTTTSTPPTTTTTIKVFVRATGKITAIPFATYVQNVLPNEWVPSWDSDALKAGAVAVKTYAWYWMSHFGGYLNGDKAQCFDVTDDVDFQVYKPNSALARTTQKITESWPVFARKSGRVFQTYYRATLTGSTSEACGAGANGTTLSQWGSQNCNEANSANKYNVILQRYYGSTVQLATTRQLRTQHDFRFLQTSSRATFSAATGQWAIDDGYPTVLRFGVSGDVATVVTNGDGFARVGVYRPATNTFYVGTPTGGVQSKVHFGVTGDLPEQAQYNGTGQPTQLAVFRPSTGTWYLATPTGQVAAKIPYGTSGDVPVPADYTGDGRADIAVFRPSNGTWYVRAGTSGIRYGQRGDVPAPADYTGDGKADVAVYRTSTHTFYVRGQTVAQYGVAGDVPVTGDFTGDGRADLAVYRPSTHVWYVLGRTPVAFGASGVRPIGAAPYHD